MEDRPITVGTTKPKNDTAIQSYKLPSKHPRRTDSSPRVFTPLEPSISDPLPSILIRYNLTILPVRPTQISSEMNEITKPITAPAFQTPNITQRPPSYPQSHPDLRLGSRLEMDASSGNSVHEPSVFDIDWEYIRNLRMDNWSLRAKVRGMRITLREKQNTKSMADDKLLQHIRMQELGTSSKRNGFMGRRDKTVMELMQDCQVARDDYGSLEFEYQQLEDELSRREFELDKLEGQFFLRWQVVPGSQPEALNAPKSEHGITRKLNLDDEDEDVGHHPLVKKYLSRAGDLDLLRERLDDIIDETRSLEEQSEVRNRVGRSLASEEQTWLDDSQRAQEELQVEIQVVEAEVEDLKKQCLLMKLVDEDGELTDFQLQSQEEKTFIEEVDPLDQISEYVKFPILLPRPGTEQEISGYDPKPDEKSDLTEGRINKWLLERLRSSPLDVNLLVRTFEGKGGKINPWFEILVLDLWFSDETITHESNFRPYSASMITQAHIRSDHSDTTEVAFIVGTSPASPRGKLS